MFFSSHLCVGLLFLGLYSLPSPPSPPELLLSLSTSPKLSHTTHRTHPRQLLSSHKSKNSSHTTPLISQLTQLVSSHKSQVTQLISHKSSLTTHLTQLNLLKSCFRVPFGGAAFVFSHWSSPKFFHTTYLTTHTTHLTQLHSSHNSQNSSHTTPLILQLTQLLSSHKSHNSSYTTHLTWTLSSQPTPPHPTHPPYPHPPKGNWSWKSSACKCSTARKMMRLLCVCSIGTWTVLTHPTPPVTDHERAVPVSALREERWWGCCACVYMNVIIPPHPTPPHPTPPPPPPPPSPPHPSGTWKREVYLARNG